MIDPLLSKIPPQNIDSEEAVLSALLIDNAGFEEIEDLGIDDFYKNSHKQIFKSMLDIRRRKDPVDLMTVSSDLQIKQKLDEIGGAAYLSYIADAAPVATNIAAYARQIMSLTKAREMIQVASSIIEQGFSVQDVEQYISNSQSKILNIQTSTSKDKFCDMETLMLDRIANIEKAQSSKYEIGLNFGMPKLDNFMQVWGSKLILLAGRPGMGKTSLALSIAKHLGYQEKKSGILSIEMDKEQYGDKLLSVESNVNSMGFYARNFLSDNSIRDLNFAAHSISSLPIYIDDSECNLEDVKRKSRKFKKMGCEIIFIDQLSQISIEKGLVPYVGISKNCTAIKQLTKELRIPIVLLCQLNRNLENRADKRPTMSDLAETGKLEQDADIILFLYREGVYDEKIDKSRTEIIMPKNRQGEKGVEKQVLFIPRLGMFQLI